MRVVVLILIQVGRLSSLPKTSGPHLYDLTTLYAPPSAKVYPVADRVDKQESSPGTQVVLLVTMRLGGLPSLSTITRI